jgi:hypothetical protein
MLFYVVGRGVGGFRRRLSIQLLQLPINDGDLLFEIREPLRVGTEPLILLGTEFLLCPFLDPDLDGYGGILGTGKVW